MVIFKKKHQALMEKLQKECDEKNAKAKWENDDSDASNRYHLYYTEYEVSHKGQYNLKSGPYGWAVREKYIFAPSKCSLTDLSCGWGGDCRECQEPITSKIITFK